MVSSELGLNWGKTVRLFSCLSLRQNSRGKVWEDLNVEVIVTGWINFLESYRSIQMGA